MQMTTPGRIVRNVSYVPVEEIVPGPLQPRQHFSREGLEELRDSIIQHGVLQPLTVRQKGERFELIAGERRLRAAKMAGLYEVPCIVMDVDMEKSGIIALIENIQRRDLDFIEEAEGILQLTRLFGLSQEQVARRLGKSQSAVANKLRILRHSREVLDALRQQELTERHARALLKLTTEPEKLEALAYIGQNMLSVAATERYIEALLSGKRERQHRVNLGAFLTGLHQSLQRIQLSGIPAVSERRETDSQIVLTITIPK